MVSQAKRVWACLCCRHLACNCALLFKPGLVLLECLLPALVHLGALVVLRQSVCSTELRSAVGALSNDAQHSVAASVILASPLGWHDSVREG